MKLALGLIPKNISIASADTSLVCSKTVDSIKSVEFIYCGCGCGLTKQRFDSRGKERKFIQGHFWRTMKHSDESKKKLSESRLGKYKGLENPFYGKKHSEQTKQKLRELHLGKKLSEETKKKKSQSMKGKNLESNHYKWKGDDVGYHALHIWVRSRLPIPSLCQICNNIPPKDLANVTGIYSRDLDNWKYMCKRCHNVFDRSRRTK